MNIPGRRCPEHGIILANIPWPEKSSRFTTRFETHAIEVLQPTDVAKASSIPGISWNQAWHIIDKAVERGLARKASNPEAIGIDETKKLKSIVHYSPQSSLPLHLRNHHHIYTL